MTINATGTVAQIQYPTDSIGAPFTGAFGGCVVDWPRMRAYLWNSNGIRSYDISTFGTKTPILSAVFPTHVLGIGTICTPDGYILHQDAGDNVSGFGVWRKLDPNTLLTVGTWGGSAYPNGTTQAENSAGGSIATVECNGVPYALSKDLYSLSNRGAIFRTDTMTGAGFWDTINTGNFGDVITGGKSSLAEATFFAVDGQKNTGNNPQLHKITIVAGAETYNPASWPTPNPDISTSSIHTFSLSELNTLLGTSWASTILCSSIGYDTFNDVVVISVSSTDAASGVSAIVGLSPSGSLLWGLLAPTGSTPGLQQLSSAGAGQLFVIGNGNNPSGFAVVDCRTGILTPLPSYAAVSGLGSTFRAYFTDDGTQTIIACVAFAAGSGKAIAAPGTPSSFGGWAMLQLWPNPLPSVAATGHVGTIGVRFPPNILMGDFVVTEHISAEPELSLRWSDTRGASWSSWIRKAFTTTGQYDIDIAFYRLGLARDRVWEVSWATPSATALTGAFISFEIAGS